jgi:hypothetical protein
MALMSEGLRGEERKRSRTEVGVGSRGEGSGMVVRVRHEAGVPWREKVAAREDVGELGRGGRGGVEREGEVECRGKEGKDGPDEAEVEDSCREGRPHEEHRVQAEPRRVDA